MDFIKEKIRVMVKNLDKWRTVTKTPLEYSYIECPEYKADNTPPGLDERWKASERNLLFEGVDTHYWLHIQIKAVAYEEGKQLRLSVKTGRESLWMTNNPQFIVYLNGVTVQALDTKHTFVPLEYDTDYDIYMYLYSGMIGGTYIVDVSLDTIDKRIEALYYDVNVPYEALLELEESSYDYVKIRNCLDKAMMKLDLRRLYSDAFYHSVDETLEYLKTEFYGRICGDSDCTVSVVGHTHIDIAWLWTVAQTREKAQRSFATAMNFIRQYPDYVFMSSQPQLYQFVKETDPELYGRIKEAVKAGRWEPEGAMWLEADTNLVSGESLIRQILYGKRFMKEEFGVDNKMLWLPDVFGYSGVLPQIMRKSGVTRFFTTKLQWNESNPMPNDTFIWEGIDGSRVFASFIMQYTNNLDAEYLCKTRQNYKNKALTDNMFLTCGYGDGGGGTTYTMVENYERLKYGIPGIPKVRMEKAGEFFDRIEKDFEENTKALKKEPKWVGEMYLEMHRGTYTSMAKNKKYNRKSELLYQEVESVSVADMVLNGGVYPAAVIRKNLMNILLNQFHDIIPGSSIKEVYDVTDEEYPRILSEGRDIVEGKLASICAAIKTDGGIFVHNPTPFEISDHVQVDGRTYFAEKVPAHGWKVIKADEVDNGIIVREKFIENDVIKVIFNDKYHIVSVFDKEENREVISKGAEANCLEVYEDYPRDYDAWEITDYYKQKMWLADDVQSVTLLPDGIRIERTYQDSTISQDVVLRRGSKRVDFVTTVDWHEDHVLLKAAFPVDIHSTRATYDIQFGNIERQTHSNTGWEAAKFEVCAHKWADLSEGDYGVSLMNDCKYGYSIEDHVMKISLLKAAAYPNPVADREVHQFTYSLYPHKGDYRVGKTVQEGYALNIPLEARKIPANEGVLPECYSLVHCEQENIVIETIKKAEDDNSVIVRLFEAYDQKAEAEIKVSFAFHKVYLCDLMEENLEELYCQDGCVKVQVKNFEIITLKFVR